MPQMTPSFQIAKAQDATAEAGAALRDARKALQKAQIQPDSKPALKNLRDKVRLAERRVMAAKSALQSFKSRRADGWVTVTSSQRADGDPSELCVNLGDDG
jgi:hypothetical protein